MSKLVVLVTGTPCVGKTSAAVLFATKLDALYINLTDLALQNGLVKEKDEKRDTLIIDEAAMRKTLRRLIDKTNQKAVVVDGHYAVNVVPSGQATYVFVLRRDPVELREFMKERGFSHAKLMENLAAEILDVCLVDALNARTKAKTCELDVTGKAKEEIVNAMLEAMSDRDKCCVGVVDWLGKLENEGLLDEFLKF